MGLPELVRRSAEQKIRDLCERRVPPDARREVRLEYNVRGNSITIVERWTPAIGPSGRP
jgi:hypothetical protein